MDDSVWLIDIYILALYGGIIIISISLPICAQNFNLTMNSVNTFRQLEFR